jgi:hypothetical protein
MVNREDKGATQMTSILMLIGILLMGAGVAVLVFGLAAVLYMLLDEERR